MSPFVTPKPSVRLLAARLRDAGLRVWLDEWVIRPGDDIYLSIERGLEASRVLVLCLSQAALRSAWVDLERSATLFRDPSNVGRRFVPLLLDDCVLPDTLRRYKYIDFRTPSDEAIKKLLEACGSAPPITRLAKPDARPVAAANGTANVHRRFGRQHILFLSLLLMALGIAVVLRVWWMRTPAIVDVTGSIYLDGQPLTVGTLFLLETASRNPPRFELAEKDQGQFAFDSVRGITDRVKLNVATTNYEPKVLEAAFVAGKHVIIRIARGELIPAATSGEFSQATAIATARLGGRSTKIGITGAVEPPDEDEEGSPAADDDAFRGVYRKQAKISVSTAPETNFSTVSDLLKSLPSDDSMRNHEPPIDTASARVPEEDRNVAVSALLYAAKKQVSGDFDLLLGDVGARESSGFIMAKVSGLPPAGHPAYETLSAVRREWKRCFEGNLPGRGGYELYTPPIPIRISGSLLYEGSYPPGVIGPAGHRPRTNWQIRPVTKIHFE
jgi:hypothetical protein